MRAKQTLQQRIVIAFFLLTLVLCGAFATVTYFVIHELETELFYDHLRQDAEWLISASKNDIPLEMPAGIQLYRIHNNNMADLPDYLQTVTSDQAEIVLGEVAYHVIVRHEDDTSYYLVQDQSRFERTEIAIGIGLLLALLIALAGSLWLGTATASRVVEPVIRLARQVRGLDGGHSGSQLRTGSFSYDEVGQLALTFEQYASRLNNFLDRERLFTGDVSHELRTPLMVISCSSELLLHESALSLKDQQRVERIYRASQEMRLLVDTFLMLSREAGDSLQPGQTFLANTIIKEEIGDLRQDSTGSSVDIHIKGNCQLELCGVSQLFRVVIRNLLRNAIHYTREGTVSVTINAETVEVEDTGPGIPEALRMSIFDRHVQGLDDGDPSQGQGLGLSIVKRVCTYHDWSIQFFPALPTGSRFVLNF